MAVAERPADMHFAFASGGDAPSNARRAVAAMLTEWDTILNEVVLTVSELVTNVVMHSSGGGVLEIWDPRPPGGLRGGVEDRSPPPPIVGGLGFVCGRG